MQATAVMPARLIACQIRTSAGSEPTRRLRMAQPLSHPVVRSRHCLTLSMAEESPLSAHDPYAPFRRPDFRRLLGAWALSGFANKMQIVAVGWYVYERTGSALAIGWVGLAQFAPALLFFLPAGQLVDRHERRSLLVASFAVAACASLLMFGTVWQEASLAWIYLACFINGTAQSLQRPARAALMPGIVPLEMLPQALSWAMGSFQAATFCGPVLSGLIIAFSGNAAINFGANAALFVCALLLAMRITTRERPQAKAGPRLGDLLAGVKHVFCTRIVLGSLLLDLASALFGGATALLPVYAKDILEVGPGGLGWMTAAPAIGSLCMGITLGHLPASHQGGWRFLLAMAAYGAATVVFAYSTWFPLSLAALFMIGMMNNINQVTRQTLMQSHTPDHLRGRASSVNSLFAASSNELGAFECGTVAALAGPVFAVASGGVITMLAAGLVGWRFPELRRLTSLTGPAPSPGHQRAAAGPPA